MEILQSHLMILYIVKEKNNQLDNIAYTLYLKTKTIEDSIVSIDFFRYYRNNMDFENFYKQFYDKAVVIQRKDKIDKILKNE